jgi:hypothetical protein
MTKPEPTTFAPPPKEGSIFRAILGFIAMAAAIGGFGALFFFEIPARNENAIMFALGAVFGWASQVISSEYGATTTGRRAAETVFKKLEKEEEHKS